MAAIGANTEPKKYKNSVISSIGNSIAAMAQMRVMPIAKPFSGSFCHSETPDTPLPIARRNGYLWSDYQFGGWLVRYPWLFSQTSKKLILSAVAVKPPPLGGGYKATCTL